MTNGTPEQHWEALRAEWLEFFTRMRTRLQKIDGDTSRQIGGIVHKIVEEGPKKHDWPDTGAALFFKRDPQLWHELADSRKQ